MALFTDIFTVRSRMLLCALACAMCISWCDTKAASWDQDSIECIFAHRQLEPIEGVWQFPADGARLLIARSTGSTFDIVLLDSPRLDIVPGISIGQARCTAKGNVYDATLDCRQLRNSKLKGANATLTVIDGSSLKIEPYSQGKKFTFRRWIPYLMRIVEDNNTRPKGLDGAKRIYPLSVGSYIPSL